ncbi:MULTISPECIES: hypothetical protein [unclassified Streptomyces]|uniref:hypothetical protein n=1 Tax=unclassified Streptomyces TaxID=2593676 RepID=UPI002E28FEE4|nr:hypothetical protein [Streptomyces sp. NBC_00223]
MGYSVLYIAFGIVALWLLGEVLLQYKARLRWRLLAFGGFMGVVTGVYLREVIVIVLGALAFGAGQTFVTLSYKRGFSTGWALGGRPGSSRRRKGAGPRVTEPVLEVTPVQEEFAPAGAMAPAASVASAEDVDMLAAQGAPDAVYQPMPMHDDSVEFPLYDGQSSYTPDPYTSGGYEGYGAHGYAGWGGDPQPAAANAGYDGGYEGGYGNAHEAGYDSSYGDGGYAGGQEQSGWGGQGYGYDQAAASYQEQPAADGYDGYGGRATGDWTPQPPTPSAPPQYGEPQPGPDSYGYYDQQQPYIPQQQQPYEQSYEQSYEPQPAQQPPQQSQPQYVSESAEYADPYDPYRY